MDSNYGIDPGIVATSDEGVVVPENPIKFSDTDMQALKLAFNPLGVSENFGIDLYEQTLEIISTFDNSLFQQKRVVIVAEVTS